MRSRAEVVIIGGGVTGASLAYHLAARGLRDVLLLERQSLASGGTGRSVGIVRQLYPTLEVSRMVARSLPVLRGFVEQVGGESGYVACGALIGVSSAMRPSLEKTVALQRSLGIRAEILEPDDVARIDSRIDTSSLGAVLYEPDSGYGDPAAVTAGYAAAARRLGVAIEQGAEVTGIRAAHGHVSGVETARGERVDSPVVVNAAGLWAPAVGRLAGVELPIVVGRHPVFVVERDAAFGPPHPVYLDLAGGSYARPETGGLTLTGSLTDDEAQQPMDPELLGSETGFEEASRVLGRTSQAIPSLSRARYRRGYAGAFDITPDWMPILDESPLRGFYIAAGLSGHGFKLAPAIGEMMATLITGTVPPVSRDPFRVDRFAATALGGSFITSYLPSR